MTSQIHQEKSNSQRDAEDDFRSIPSVSLLLEHFRTDSLDPLYLTPILRNELERARHDIARGISIDREEIFARCQHAIDQITTTRLDSAINGTGVILHTNLGRAPVSRTTAKAMADAAGSNLSLELDPESNQRGGRMDEVSRLMHILTGAEATLVVNNNAGAVLLTLAALCAGGEVVVSRGEAVEIGGGFRIPDVIAQSGCRLVDAGATNRTYASDYEQAIRESTAALLKVHASNFRIAGFTATTSTSELATLASSHDIPLIEDLGSGALLETSRYGLRREPTVQEVLEAGAAVVTMSGDKLLGGPQAGLIAGRAELIHRIALHPLHRALRADKVTLAGVNATLRHYLAGNAETEIPIWRMIAVSQERLSERARAIAGPLGLDVVTTETSIGGGSMPGETLPSSALAIRATQPEALALKLRTGTPRVFPVIRNGRVLIDLRTVLPELDPLLNEALTNAIG